MVHAWTRHRVLFTCETSGRIPKVLSSHLPKLEGLCGVEARERSRWPRVRFKAQERIVTLSTPLSFLRPFPTFGTRILKAIYKASSLTGKRFLCLLSFHCVLFTRVFHFVGVIEPQPLSARDPVHVLSRQRSQHPAPPGRRHRPSPAFSLSPPHPA